MKKLLSIFILVLVINSVSAQVSKTVNVTTAGTLSTLLTEAEKSTVTDLTLTGNIDARDFSFMHSYLSVLSVLNISNVNIVEYVGLDGTQYMTSTPITYPKNEIPTWSFRTVGLTSGNSTLTKISLPETTTSVGYNAISYCPNLNQITLPESITSIGISAFSHCNNLKQVTIPSKIATIYSDAFGFCTNLEKVIFRNSTPPSFTSLSTYAFCTNSYTKSFPIFYVPVGTVELYKNCQDDWKQYKTYYEYILTVKTKPSTSISLSTAVLNANIDLITDTPISSHGFCWNTTGSPTITDNKVDKGATTTLGSYDYTITNLQPATTYFVKSFATDGERTVYGNEVSFTTASIPDAAGTISGIQTVCQGQNSVTYTVPTIAYATSYIWTLPTGVTGTSSTNSITVNYAKTFTAGNISVNGHNSWGDGAVSTLAINANLLPENAGIITGNNSVCQGENSVTYSVPTINNATSYIWTLPSGVTGSSTTNIITVNYSKTATSGNITVKGHNDCGDGVAYSLPIVVNQLPIVTTTNKSIVSGGSISLNPTINYTGTGTLKYKWTPSTGLNYDSIANPTATVTKNTTYTITVTSSNGCSTTNSVTISIIPMSKPEIGIVGVNSSNKNIVVWNKPVTTGIQSYYIYRETTVSDLFEKVGNVSYDSLSIFVDNQSNAIVKSNKYKLSILDRSGFESPQSNAHKTMHLSIYKGQNTTWNLNWENYEGFNVATYNIYRGTNANNLSFIDATSGSSTQYTDLSAPTGDVCYQLEVISPNLINPTKAPASIQKSKDADNSFEASLVSYNSSRSNIVSNFISSVSELTGDNIQINIYPNPVKDQLRIDYDGGSTFEILNLMGQVVYNGDLINSTVVKTSSLSSGVYLIKFKAGKTFEYRKIIKE